MVCSCFDAMQYWLALLCIHVGNPSAMPQWEFDDTNALNNFHVKSATIEVEFDDTNNAVSNSHANSPSQSEIVWHTVQGL